MDRFGMLVALVLVTLLGSLARADGSAASAADVHDGMAARTRRPPDNEAARAAFERAAGSKDAEVAAHGLFFLGEMDEEAMRFADAVAHYDASIARLPSNRYAQRAASRSNSIRSHAEGGYAPLARLETVRRDPALASDPAAIDALVRDAESFPPGSVRVEARLLAAEAYRGRIDVPGGARAAGDAQIALLWLVVRDPRADVIASREAAVEIVDALVRRGDLDAAARAEGELGGKLDAPHRAQIVRLLRRRVAHTGALLEIGLVLGLLALGVARGGAATAARAARRATPAAALFCAFASLVGGALAATYESGSALPFWMIGPAMFVAIVVARAWSAVGSRARLARVARATLCASSVFAAALLLLERVTPEYLEGFGL